ncbi:nucleotidyltransferase domain-containing protein [Patescibacteria group bacterium]|nr:nucleotidyltransferase domain-containing protein [Patescibacteria group bacterium]MBU1500364.1 nucleotidyltransferase domain-containing protein [Patescibacteria group bacterium]
MEQLLISPKILKIIAVFLSFDQPLYVREIARKLNFPPATVSRILQRLLRRELLTSQKKGNLKLFQLNPHFPSLPEIKSLVQKESGQIPLLTQALKQIPLVSLATVYGSAAKNQLTSTSDIDLLIVGSPPVDELNQQLNRLEKTLSREINYSLYSPKEFFSEKKKPGFLRHVLSQQTINIINRPFYEPEKKLKKHYS